MKYRLSLLISLCFLITSVFAATQSHPTSQLSPEGSRDADLNLGSYNIILNAVKGYIGTRNISLIESSSNLFGLTLGSGGFSCTTCIDTNDIANSAIDNSKLADNSVSSGKMRDGAVVNTKIASGAVNGTQIIDGAIKAVDVDSAQIQKRVTGSCTSMKAIVSIGEDGIINCDDVGTAPTTKYPLSSTGGQTPEFSLLYAGLFTLTGTNELTIAANAIGNSLLASDSGSLNKVSGGAITSDGTDVTLNRNIKIPNTGCISNSTGSCKIQFDANGNVIINI